MDRDRNTARIDVLKSKKVAVLNAERDVLVRVWVLHNGWFRMMSLSNVENIKSTGRDSEAEVDGCQRLGLRCITSTPYPKS